MFHYGGSLYRRLILPFENSIPPIATELRHFFVFILMHVHGKSKMLSVIFSLNIMCMDTLQLIV